MNDSTATIFDTHIESIETRDQQIKSIFFRKKMNKALIIITFSLIIVSF
jgi:hypothetical protein